MAPFWQGSPWQKHSLEWTEAQENITWKLGQARYSLALSGHRICRNLGLECGSLFFSHYLPALAVACLFLQPPLWEPLPVLNEQLITLEGGINWSESCLGWLSSCLCGLAAISSKHCDCVSSPQAPQFTARSRLLFSSFSLPFKSCLGCNYSCQELGHRISV